MKPYLELRTWCSIALAGAGLLNVGCGGDESLPSHVAGNVAWFNATIDRQPSTAGVAVSTLVEAEFRQQPPETLLAPGKCRRPAGLDVGKQFDGGSVTLFGVSQTRVRVPKVTSLSGQPLGYGLVDATHALWQPGAKLTIETSGSADVPGFLISAIAPNHVELIMPSETKTTVVERAQGLRLTWTPFDRGDLIVELSGPSASRASEQTLLDCAFSGGDGAGTVASSSLDGFARGTVRLTMVASALETFVDDDWRVLFSVTDAGSATSRGVEIDLR